MFLSIVWTGGGRVMTESPQLWFQTSAYFHLKPKFFQTNWRTKGWSELVRRFATHTGWMHFWISHCWIFIEWLFIGHQTLYSLVMATRFNKMLKSNGWREWLSTELLYLITFLWVAIWALRLGWMRGRIEFIFSVLIHLFALHFFTSVVSLWRASYKKDVSCV